MNNLSEIKGILTKIEESVDILDKRYVSKRKLNEVTDEEKAELMKLAKAHFALEKKISDLELELASTNDKLKKTDDTIKAAVNKIKGKSIKLGKIIMRIRNITVITRESFSYKRILDELRETLHIEKKIIDPIIKKYHTPAKEVIDPQLQFAKESINKLQKLTGRKVRLIEEPFLGGFVNQAANKVLAIFKGLFSAFSNQVDKLEKELDKLDTTNVGGANFGGKYEAVIKSLDKKGLLNKKAIAKYIEEKKKFAEPEIESSSLPGRYKSYEEAQRAAKKNNAEVYGVEGDYFLVKFKKGRPQHYEAAKSKKKLEAIKWTPYLATAYAEGFAEGEDASEEEQLEAWAYLIKTGLCWSLQGWFGRRATELIRDGLISKDGKLKPFE